MSRRLATCDHIYGTPAAMQTVRHFVSSLPERHKARIRRFIPPRVRLIRTGHGTLRNDAEASQIARFARSGSTAIDGGAHIGGFTWVLAQAVGPTGFVIAVEPQPALVALVRKGVEALKLPVTLRQCALGSSEGSGTLHIPIVKGHPFLGFASLRRPNVSDNPYQADSPLGDATGTDPGYESETLVEVPIRTLDAIAAEAPSSVTFVKLDLEGTELDALRGAETLLSEQRPVLLLEIDVRRSNGPIADTHAFLREQGYRAVVVRDDALQPVDEGDDLGQLPINVFFLPKEHTFLTDGKA